MPSDRVTSHLETDTKAVEQRIEEIRNRLAEITPGPWEPETGGPCVWHLGSGDTICEVNFDHQTGEHQPGEDQEFIASAPSDIAFLLEQLASIPAQIKAAVQAEREAWSDVRRIGAQLSNTAYNLSHAGKDRVVTEHERKVLAVCASDWDAAIRARGEAK